MTNKEILEAGEMVMKGFEDGLKNNDENLVKYYKELTLNTCMVGKEVIEIGESENKK